MYPLSGITRRAPFVERRVLDNIAPLDDRRKEGPSRGRRSRPESAYDWILEVESGPLAGQRYGLEGSVVIGRSAELRSHDSGAAHFAAACSAL